MDRSWWRVLTKCGPLEKETANHFSILAFPMNRMKRQKDMALKDELPSSIGPQYATGKEYRNSSRRNEKAESKQKQHKVMDVSDGESKF